MNPDPIRRSSQPVPVAARIRARRPRRRPVLVRAGLGQLALVMTLAAAGLAATAPVTISSTDPPDTLSGPHARVELVSETGLLTPGETAWLGIRFLLQEGWHLYWNGRNDTGFPPSVQLQAPQGYVVGSLLWPAPIRHLSPGEILDHVYEQEVTLLLPLEVPRDAGLGSTVRLAGTVDWLACREICVPESGRIELSLPVAAARSASEREARTELFAKARARLPRTIPNESPSVLFAWTEDTLVVRVPGARSLAFYPSDSSVALIDPIGDPVGRGERLSIGVRRSADAGTKERMAGVLEVERSGDGVHDIWSVDVPLP